MLRSSRRLATVMLVAAGVAFVPATTATALPALVPAASTTVSAMTAPIYRVEHANGNTLLTPWKSEADNAVKNLGWSRYEVVFMGSTEPSANSEPVYRMYNPSTRSFLFTASAREYKSAQKHGFRQEGVGFHVPAWDMAGTEKVYRLHKVVNGAWRYRDALGAQQRDALVGQGWVLDGQAFRAVAPAGDAIAPKPEQPVPASEEGAARPEHPGDGDGVFRLAQFNDTQHDVFPDSRWRLESRVDWLLDNAETQDIRFITHSGDVVNWWDTKTNNENYRIADEVLQPLAKSGIPFSVSIGNHDSKAVADGAGWANTDPVTGKSMARQGLRDTKLINDIFPAQEFTNMRGQFEPGKFDNSFHTFRAEGADFLVLNLELWPRQAALDWAKNVVEDHPQHNVVLVTHSFLTSSGAVYGGSEYGDLPATEIDRQLVRAHPNVKLVLSGHTGTSASRIITDGKGNDTLAVVTNMAPSDHGPLRLFDIDVDNGKVRTEIVRTTTNSSGGYAFETDIDWIR